MTDSLRAWILNSGSAITSDINEMYIPWAGGKGAEGTVINGCPIHFMLLEWKDTPCFVPGWLYLYSVGWSISTVRRCWNGRGTSEPWRDMLCLPNLTVPTEQGSGTGHCDLPCPAPSCRESTFATFPRLDTFALLEPLSTLHSKPWCVQSTPVEKAFRIRFLKWLLLNRNSAR